MVGVEVYNYGHVLMWIHVHLAFAVIRAINLCLRGSGVRCWQNHTNIDDGADLPNVLLNYK